MPDNYTITFTDATDYQVTDNTTGTTWWPTAPIRAGGAIAFDGMQVEHQRRAGCR